MVKDQDKSKKYEDAKGNNPLANFRPIRVEDDIWVGPTEKCCNCGKENLLFAKLAIFHKNLVIICKMLDNNWYLTIYESSHVQII